MQDGAWRRRFARRPQRREHWRRARRPSQWAAPPARLRAGFARPARARRQTPAYSGLLGSTISRSVFTVPFSLLMRWQRHLVSVVNFRADSGKDNDKLLYTRSLPWPVETEIKFRVDVPTAFEERLGGAGFHLVTPRSFESNVLYDTPDRRLRARTEILRIRSYAGKWTLTHKRLPEDGPGEDKHKHRIETETEIADGKALAEVFHSLGLVPRSVMRNGEASGAMAGAIAWWMKRRSAIMLSSKARGIGSIGSRSGWAWTHRNT